MRDFRVAPPLRLTARAPSSVAPASALGRLRARYDQLDRLKRLILIGLATLALVIIVATTAYALIPAGIDASGARQPAALSTLAPTASSTAVAGQPPLAGHFVLSDISTSALTLDLQIFGANVVGTLTTQSCVGRPVTAVVTGHFLDATSLVLTVAQPQAAHATTIFYTVTHTDEGFSLAWRDSSGQSQVQHWMTATRSADSSACQTVP